MDPKSAQMILDSARDSMGEYLFRRLTKAMNRQRVPPNREKRKDHDFDYVRGLAERQDWICGICNDEEKPMRNSSKYTVLDHIDPHRIDFENPENHQASHASCNSAKSANTQAEESKRKQLEKQHPEEKDSP